MTAVVILICHASTVAVHKAAFPVDEPLDDKGRARAAKLARDLPSANRWLTSPELRTRQTADALQLDAEVQPQLRDCDYGRWSGSTFDDVCEREPEAAAAWLSDPAAVPHGGESILSVMRRVADWLAAEQTQHRRSIIVTHATIIRSAIVHAIAAAPQSFCRIDIAPLSITRLSGSNGRWNFVAPAAASLGEF
jgi:broad specificity phosphatase PhoE